MGNELRLKVSRDLQYFWMRGKKGMNVVRLSRVFNADVTVSDQSVV